MLKVALSAFTSVGVTDLATHNTSVQTLARCMEQRNVDWTRTDGSQSWTLCFASSEAGHAQTSMICLDSFGRHALPHAKHTYIQTPTRCPKQTTTMVKCAPTGSQV